MKFAETLVTGKVSLDRRIVTLLALAALVVAVALPSIAGSTLRAGHGVLVVETSPEVPSNISVNGVPRNLTAISDLELPVGEHEVSFSTVDGYLAPSPVSVTITEGETTHVVGEFSAAGTLEITTEPANLAPIISVDGIERDRGATSLTVAVGEAEVCGSDLEGYATPRCETVTIDQGQTSQVVLGYTLVSGEAEPTELAEPEDGRVLDGLVSFYDFAGGGAKVVDRVGGNDLTITDPSAVSWVEGGLSFDSPTLARTEGAPRSLYDAIAASQQLTMEAWVTPANSTQNGPARIVSLGRSTTAHNMFIGQGEFRGASTVFETRIGRDSNDQLHTAEGSLELRPMHLVATYGTDDIVSVYLDGELAIQQRVSTPIDDWDTSYLLGMGNELDGKRPWLGTYHLLSFYDTALDADQVATNYQAGLEAEFYVGSPEPAEPEPAEPEDSVTAVPSDWQDAFESGDIEVIRAWYRKNTGHEANGYSIDVLEDVGHIVTEHDGQVIEGVLAGSIRIAHDDVTIRNSRITSAWGAGIRYMNTWGRENGGTLIEHVTFDGWDDAGQEGNIHRAMNLPANEKGAVIRRVNISGYSMGAALHDNATFEESYVHTLYRGEGSGHGTSVTIRGANNTSVRNLMEGPGGSSAQSIYADSEGPVHNTLVEYNVFNDARPHYQINVPNREFTAESQNVRIRHNRYGPDTKSPAAGLQNFVHPTTDIRDNRDL